MTFDGGPLPADQATILVNTLIVQLDTAQHTARSLADRSSDKVNRTRAQRIADGLEVARRAARGCYPVDTIG